jgi:hypothetical protein
MANSRTFWTPEEREKSYDVLSFVLPIGLLSVVDLPFDCLSMIYCFLSV